MRHFQVWGLSFLLVTMVGCGETANLVGNMPDEGGSGGTKSNGGTDSAGTTSHAGASNGGVTSHAGTGSGGTTQSGGTGAGGTTPSGGTGMGGATNGGTGMGGAVTGCQALGGNWQTCDRGIVHRTEPGQCENKLTGSGTVQPISAQLDECTKDSQCTKQPMGYCAASVGGLIEPHNACFYGCQKDSDCDASLVCLCGSSIGTCVRSSGCASDQDCSGGSLCTTYDTCPGVPVTDFACQKPADQCTTDADCTGTPTQFCAIGNGDHRECVPGQCEF
jgi:hypothetical protein